MKLKHPAIFLIHSEGAETSSYLNLGPPVDLGSKGCVCAQKVQTYILISRAIRFCQKLKHLAIWGCGCSKGSNIHVDIQSDLSTQLQLQNPAGNFGAFVSHVSFK